MQNSTEVKIHMKKSAMTVVDALEKVGAKVDGVEHEGTRPGSPPPPPGQAVHRVTWSALADTQVRSELRRLEKLGEVEIARQ